MAIQFCEIKKYIARNERISICLEDGSYDNYLMISDIPEGKYDNLYVYGIGTVDVEFSKDMYAAPSQLEKMVISPKHDMMAPAIEIVLHKDPRDIERCEERCMLFKDLKNSKYLKQKESNVSKAHKKSKHKHQYAECLIRYKCKWHEKDEISTCLRSYCVICGKIHDRMKNSIVKDYKIKVVTSHGTVYQFISDDDLYEKYHDRLPVFFVDIWNDNYVNLNDENTN